MRKLALLCLLASLFVSSAADARADDDSLRDPTIRKVHSRYGNQTLLCDMGALGLTLTGIAVGADGTRGTARAVIMINGGALFLVGGPIVHLAHGHPVRALLDFGLRAVVLGGPLALGIPWIAREHREGGDPIGENFAVESTAVMIALGFGAVTALDAAVFTRETKNVTLEPSASRSPIILPGFSVARGGATLGVHGAF